MTRNSLRSARCFPLVLAVALAVAATALAQVGEQKEAADFAQSGKVTAVDAVKHSITVQGPNQDGGTYDVDPKAMMKNGDKTIGLADVKVGWHVSVNGDLRGAKKVVTYLEVNETQ